MNIYEKVGTDMSKRGRPKKERTEEIQPLYTSLPRSLYDATKTYASLSNSTIQDVTSDALRSYFSAPEHQDLMSFINSRREANERNIEQHDSKGQEDDQERP